MKKRYDIIVCGAGIAGITAAVKASRPGASTLIIEQYHFVGGMSTAGLVSPFMKHSVNDIPLVRGIFEEIELEMIRTGGMINNGFNSASFRLAAYKLLKESGCDILFDSTIVDTDFKNRSLTSVTVITPVGLSEFEGNIFIDTTGDARLVFLAGLPFNKGDEKSGLLQALTLFFRMGGINMETVAAEVKKNPADFLPWVIDELGKTGIVSVAGFLSHVEKARKAGLLSKEIEYIFFTTLPETGEGSFNTTNILELDGSDSEQLTKAEFISRIQTDEVVNLLISEVPGFENAFLIETAPQVGVRETRRVIGDYIVTGEDIKTGAKFQDVIARGCYGIDIHGQKDESSRMEDLPEGLFYEIPLRALIVKEADNLLSAGKCISSTREGQSALRIMPTSAATGEACGALAALAVKSGKQIREIDHSDVQKELEGNI